MQEAFMSLNEDDNVCLSGGAEGSDLMWGMTAGSRGDGVIHFIFRGHRSKAPDVEKVVLRREQLLVADVHLERANQTLRRRWPVSNDFVASLLRRNYYQVAWSHACYAVSEIGRDQLVKGGTAWATTMYNDIHPEGRCYVFDQKQEQWFQWKGAWLPIIAPPAPKGVWAGIGTRELNDAGKKAIRSLMGWKTPEPAITIP